MTILQSGAIASTGGYQIERSLRFNSADSAYLNRTPASAGNRKTWTWSGWVKRSQLGAINRIFSADDGSASSDQDYNSLFFTSSDQIQFGGNITNFRITTPVYRDISAWYHIVLAVDTTQATAADRFKLYVNGVQVTAFGTSNNPSQNTDLAVNAAIGHYIGSIASGSYFNGYLTEINFVDSPVLVGSTTNSSTTVTLTTGTTTNIGIGWNVGGTNIPSGATVSSITSSTQFVISSAATGTGSSISIGVAPPVNAFGETDSATGVWKPKAYSGTYGTNGFFLKFADNSGTTSTTLGKDSSGNGNNWTPNNFSVTAGVNNDSMVDSPTQYGTDTGAGGEVRGNYCTLNGTSIGANATLSNGNLDISYGSATTRNATMGTFGMSSGKWYWETTIVSLGTPSIGITNTPSPSDVSNYPGFAANGWSYISDGTKYHNLTGVAYGATYTTNDVIGVAFDADTRELTFYKNGVSQGVAYTGLAVNTYFPAFGDGSAAGTWSGSTNFGQRPFQKWNGSAFVANTAPSGFKALCTQNLPTPTIGATSTTQANDYFDITLWTGDGGSSRTITNSGNFQPDLIWVRDRVTTQNHAITDRVRGAGYILFSDATNANYTPTTYGQVTAFNSDGFTASKGSDPNFSYFNKLSNTYVGWQWKANGAGSSNTNGSVTSTVSVNTTSKFSIVTFTDPNNASNYTVGHGLGAIPSMIIHKETGTTGNWIVWHSAVMSATNQYLLLNSTAGTATLTDIWGAAVPTANVFGLKSGTSVSGGDTVVAYCFAPVAGYSAFGSYTGNNSATDGTFVYLGFRPRFLMIKSTSGSTSWVMMDSARNTYNLADTSLYAESANSEATIGTVNDIDFLSNGFKLRNNTGFVNASQTYIYAAFAETPFKYSLAR